MDFSTAVNILGGFTLGGLLLLGGLFAFAVVRTIQIRKGNKNALSGAVKPIKIIFILGTAVGLVSLVFMFASGSVSEVGTLINTMKSKDRAIYNNSMYVKTSLTYNGTSDYSLKNITAYSGENDINIIIGYKKFDVITAMNSNITGSLFVNEDSENAFIKFYTDYRNNFDITATLDKKDAQTKPTDISSKTDAELFSILHDEKNFREVDAAKIPYSDSLAEEKSVIISATSKDKLVTEQIRIYPKDKNGKFIKALADGETMLYYELNEKYNTQIKKLFE